MSLLSPQACLLLFLFLIMGAVLAQVQSLHERLDHMHQELEEFVHWEDMKTLLMYQPHEDPGLQNQLQPERL